MNAPLRRPSTRRCPHCQCQRPLGHFSEHVQLDHDPRHPRRIEYEVCRECRAGSTSAPGRTFR